MPGGTECMCFSGVEVQIMPPCAHEHRGKIIGPADEKESRDRPFRQAPGRPAPTGCDGSGKVRAGGVPRKRQARRIGSDGSGVRRCPGDRACNLRRRVWHPPRRQVRKVRNYERHACGDKRCCKKGGVMPSEGPPGAAMQMDVHRRPGSGREMSKNSFSPSP